MPTPVEYLPDDVNVNEGGEGSEEQPPGSGYTYRQLMTNTTYGLNFFLARSGSMHNLGLALDLTLERKRRMR